MLRRPGILATLVAAALAVRTPGPVRSNYVRMVRTSPATYELQTADVRLSLADADGRAFSVDLVSTVHVAEASYYAGVQAQCDEYDRTLFELLIDEQLVTSEIDDSGHELRRLSTRLQAAPALSTLAAQNGLATQVEALDCTRECWVLADVSRRQLAVQEARLQQPGLAAGRNTLAPGFASLAAPLRLLLVGPSGASVNSRGSLLRPLLGLLPAPELCLLLDDWIAAGGPELSPALPPLAAALSRLDLRAAQRLSFAQTLAGGETTQEGSLAGALLRWRNGRAMSEVEAARVAGCSRLALVYGALHMRDLRARLQQQYALIGVGEPSWRTAWTVSVAPDDDGAALPLLITFGVLLLAVDAADWLDAAEAVVRAVAAVLTPALEPELSATLEAPDGVAALGGALVQSLLYLGRHAVLYLALQRWAFEYNSRWWAVEAS